MFLQYKKDNADRDCHYVADDTFLRGRWPGHIVVTEDAHENLNYQAIIESVYLHLDLWKDELKEKEEKEELGEDQAKKENFYGM